MRSHEEYRHARENLDGSSPLWPWARVYAHRCGGTLAPENTLPGLDVAQRLGVGVEFDVMLSADGVPFLMHDKTLERTTNGSGPMADTSAAVLRTLDAGYRFAPDFAGTPVPELAAALARCAALGLDVNVEIKPARPARSDAVATAMAVIEAMRARPAGAPPPLVSSFSETALATMAAHAPDMPRGLLVSRVPDDWAARCARLGVAALHANAAHLTVAHAKAIKAAGLWLVVYTENTPTRAAALFGWGVDCVITDRPDRIRAPGNDS